MRKVFLIVILFFSTVTFLNAAEVMLGKPTVTWNLTNNSKSNIKISKRNCGANTLNFPSSINSASSKTVSSISNNAGVYACIIGYQSEKAPFHSCEFNVSRMAAGKQGWSAPLIRGSNTRECSGNISSITSGYDGDFSVNINYKF